MTALLSIPHETLTACHNLVFALQGYDKCHSLPQPCMCPAVSRVPSPKIPWGQAAIPACCCYVADHLT